LILAAALALPGAASAVDLSVAGLTVTQAIQTDDQAVPLIADRRAFVRVFVVADGDNSLKPKVRLQFVYGRKIRHQTTFGPPRELVGVPREVVRHDHGMSWNVTVPAAWIQPGLKLIAEVDPDRRVRESNEGNNLWPSKSGQPFDVRNTAPLKVTFVPVRLPDGRTSEITTKNTEAFVSYTRRVFPVAEKVDVVVHKVFSTSADIISSFDGWRQLLFEIEALRVVERTRDRYYAGLVNPIVPGAIGGLGFAPGRSTVSTEWPRPMDEGRLTYREYVIGHEIGHNLSLPHAPCGNPGDPDPDFPYEQANIGRHGFDVFVNRAYVPESGAVDLMSYCTTQPWISDYNYLNVMRYRGQVTGRSTATETSAVSEGEALLVWGRETEAGWVLEPAFRVRGAAEMASGSQAVVSLVDGEGRVAVRQGVRLSTLDHLPGQGFAALIPVDEDFRPAAIRLEIGGRRVAERRAQAVVADRSALSEAPRAFRTDDETVQLAWDAESQPLVMLRDADSGEVLGFARGGRLEVATRGQRLELLLSNGVDSVTRRFEVP
jgi:hypothetical protein